MRKPADWPRYVKCKRLADGRAAYYWEPTQRDRAAGFSLKPEALGHDYGKAIERARLLNEHLDAWRAGSDTDPRVRPGFGSFDWLLDAYQKSRAWDDTLPRTQKEYRKVMALVADMPSQAGKRFGSYSVGLIDARVVDKVYDRLISEGRGGRIRTANLATAVIARAWDTAHRLYPRDVPAENPWRGIVRQRKVQETKPCTRAEAYALAEALKAMGYPELGAIPLICWEWHQRPENVIAHFSRADYRPPEKPDHVRVFHHKTGELVWLPLTDGSGSLFPEVQAYFDLLTWGGRLTTLSESRVRVLVRKARKMAELPDHVTLAACRHGGMTELGDAGLTEQGVMSLSGHKTPEASRLYVKRTERQRIDAARKRRKFVENAHDR